MLFNTKNGINEFPWRFFDLSKRIVANSSIKSDKSNHSLKYFLLILIFAGIYNSKAVAGQFSVLGIAQNLPVSGFSIYKIAVAHCDRGESANREVSGALGKSEFQLIKQSVETTTPMQVSVNNVDNDGKRNCAITKLHEQLNILNHYLNLYFICTVFFMVSIPIIYLWERWSNLREYKRLNNNLLSGRRK